MSREGGFSGLSLFALWFGAAVCLTEIMAGSLYAPLGLGKGVTAIVLGHLVGVLILAFVGLIGYRQKAPALISSRTSLGVYGSYLVSVLNIIQLVGWTAIMLIVCARSLQSLAGMLFGFGSFAGFVVITGLLVGLWALSTERGITLVNNIAVLLLLVLSGFMVKAALAGEPSRVSAAPLSFGAALELSVAMPLSWVPLISDYTMGGRSERGCFWGSFLGYFLGSSLMYTIGLLAATYTGTSDIIKVMARLGLGVPALLIVVLSTTTTTFLDVYSAVMSTLNLSERFSRKKLIVFYTALGTLLALFFPMEQYENFLYMIGSLFAPVFSVVLLDYFVLRLDNAQAPANVPGLVAAACGVAVYYGALKIDFPLGATLPAMGATVLVYLVFRFLRNKLGLAEQPQHSSALS